MKVNAKIPNEQELLDNLGKIAYTLDKTYLSRLDSDFGILPFDEYYNQGETISFSSNIRALQVKRWVYDKDEKISDCFKNVMSVFSGSESSLALVVHRTPSNSEMFFVTKNVGQARNEDSKNDIELLADAFRGNFPGTDVAVVDSRNDDTQKLFNFSKFKSISALCNVPSEKSEDYICQGLDKLLNGIVPQNDDESYFVVVLAEAIPQAMLREILNGYQEMATAITPFVSYQFQAGENATETEGEMESLSHSEGISHSVTKTHSINIGLNGGVNSSTNTTAGGGTGASILGISANVFASITKSLGASLGASVGYGYSWGTTDTKSTTDTKTKGTNHSVSLGTSANTTYTYKSYVVADLIEKLEATIKRINDSQSTGLWKCASYVFAQNSKTSKNIANFLRSITQGDDSFIEPSYIQEWPYQGGNGVTTFGEAIKYLQHFCHPVFVNGQDNILVTPTMNASTTELSNVFAFPRYSVQGLPVVECARFGREPHSLIMLKKDFSIGCAYHMHSCVSGRVDCKNCDRKDTNKARVSLGKDELTKHTFITGSTGSGKSNTIYKLIEQLCFEEKDYKKNNTKFLVIEPAKGEYKDVFGGCEDVTVYGTNPFKVPNLLQINPFSFPDDVHVLEHIDRLVEVFNACWPMYAAMPSILKESIEKAYEDCGWNLKLSKNPGKFPSFDVLRKIIPEVVKSSEYSADTSSDYKGALETRIRSLTRGIHGQIFASDVPSEKLFDENVIIDLSRVGSQETKALIMGILVLKLQEYRMSKAVGSDNKLKHITILEEAHNLLRRTSSEQSQESSNLQGKSVEMLANAIAEMRTYGEGFVIADQSPGLMDMSVIRNTNTKIIMRLPDESDRRLVGKAAGLTDSQVDELARLEQGVAAISQSDWLEPVLCKVDEFTNKNPMEKRFKTDSFEWIDDENIAIQQFMRAALDVEHTKLTKDVIDEIRNWYGNLSLSEKARDVFESVLEGNIIDGKQKVLLVYYVVGNKLKKIVTREDAMAEVKHTLLGKYSVEENSEVIRRINELFLLYYPINTVHDSTIEQVEKLGKKGNPL